MTISRTLAYAVGVSLLAPATLLMAQGTTPPPPAPAKSANPVMTTTPAAEGQEAEDVIGKVVGTEDDEVGQGELQATSVTTVPCR